MAVEEAMLRPLGGVSGVHPSDLLTCTLLPLSLLSSLSLPLSPLYRHLCITSLGLLLSSLLSLLTSWSSRRLSLPHLGTAALTLFLLPPSSRPATYTIYWAIISLPSSTRALLSSFPRSFTLGEATLVCQALLLLTTSLLLTALSLPEWSLAALATSSLAWVRALAAAVGEEGATASLLALWSLLGVASLSVVAVWPSRGWQVTTRTRKVFHLAVVLVYSSGLAAAPTLLTLASALATLAMVALEVVRVSQLLPSLSASLTSSLAPFLDSKDGGKLILTHLYLLVGVSLPIWLWPGPLQPSSLALHSGILATGVVDSVASVVGSLWGSHRLANSSRTVEGTVAGAAAGLLYVLLLSSCGGVAIPSWPPVLAAVLITAATEAVCWQVDNLVLPLVTYTCLLLLS